MISIKDQDNLDQKIVLLRLDLNVPLKDGIITDETRIDKILPIFEFLIKKRSKIIIISHVGRPKGNINKIFSLKPICQNLEKKLKLKVRLINDDIFKLKKENLFENIDDQIVFLENVRFYDDEIKNDSEFCAQLAKHGDIFINDAFGTAHRTHASNVGIAKYFSIKGIGLLFEKELNFLSKILSKPSRPLTLVLGGAKIDTKIGLIDHYIGIADHILIGGGMAFTLLKARGIEIGKSIVDDSKLKAAIALIDKAKKKKNLFFPKDIVCAKSIDKGENYKTYDITKIPKNLMGLDIGQKTIDSYSKLISNSQTVIWNGPMGVFESENFQNGTQSLGKHIAACSQGEFVSIIGGGDTAAALRKFNLDNKMTHLSTGGGASIELLSGKNLPAIFALEV